MLTLALALGSLLNQAAPDKNPKVRRIIYENISPVSMAELQRQLKERGIDLLERPYDQVTVDRVKVVLGELLVEKGRGRVEISSRTSSIPPRSIEVTFTARDGRD